MDDLKKTTTAAAAAAEEGDDDDNNREEEKAMIQQSSSHSVRSGTDKADDDADDDDDDDEAMEEIFTELQEPHHKTILGGDATSSAMVSLQRCNLQDCCDNRVHCPFCDTRQYKPTQPARVRDHLHLTHFQHAVYYDGMMIVKCFHACRGGSSTKGGHYHCPVCSTTLLKRNAFTNHLLSHAAKQGLDSNAVQAPDSKKPSVIYYDDHKIELCHGRCLNIHEPHFHCPLCQKSCAHLSALVAHLWRCEKRATSMASKVDVSGYSLNVPKLFSPEVVQGMPRLRELEEYKWHASIVRNLSDVPLGRCDLADCCKGRYHCPLCTTAKLKPNHLCHLKQHLVSHWRSGVPFQSYTVLVCYLPCELAEGVDRIRFHYHCPLCGATRRRRQSFARHLQICDPTKPSDLAAEEEMEEGEEKGGGGGGGGSGEDDCGTVGKFPVDGDTFVPLSETDAWPSHSVAFGLAKVATFRRASADQAELQAAESLVDLDLRIQMESRNKTTNSDDVRVGKELNDALKESSVVSRMKNRGCSDRRKSVECSVSVCSEGRSLAVSKMGDGLDWVVGKSLDAPSSDGKETDVVGDDAECLGHRTTVESVNGRANCASKEKASGNDTGKDTDCLDHRTTVESENNNTNCSSEDMETESLDENCQSLDGSSQEETLNIHSDSWNPGVQSIAFDKVTGDSLYSNSTTLELVKRVPNLVDADTLIEYVEKNSDCVNQKTDACLLLRAGGASLDLLCGVDSGNDDSVSSLGQTQAGMCVRSSCGWAVGEELVPSQSQRQVVESSSVESLHLSGQECLPSSEGSMSTRSEERECQMSNESEEQISELCEANLSSSFTRVSQSDTWKKNQSDADRKKNDQSDADRRENDQSNTDRRKNDQSNTCKKKNNPSDTDGNNQSVTDTRNNAQSNTSWSDDGNSANDNTLSSPAGKRVSDLQEVKEETVLNHTVDDRSKSAASDKQKPNSESNAADTVQIFQQVSTQISDSTVQELSSRGILEESLQLIGRLCQVTWQQRGDMVTMTCDLEKLCHAQDCFKQILKEGLETLQRPPSREQASLSDNATTPQPTPKMPPRKRGRPKGSKNKATLLKEEEEESSQTSKRLKRSRHLATTENKAAENLENRQSSCSSGETTAESQESGKSGLSRNKDGESSSPPLGQYSRRTRGKRINFVRLNAGNISPARDEKEMNESPKKVDESQPAPKRGRGRPRKGPSVGEGSAQEQKTGPKSGGGRGKDSLSRAGKRKLTPPLAHERTVTESSSQPGKRQPQRLCAEKKGRKGEEDAGSLTNEKPSNSLVHPGARKVIIRGSDCQNSCDGKVIVLEDRTQDISGGQDPSRERGTKGSNSVNEVVWVPHVSAAGQPQRRLNPPSIPIVISTPKSPPKPFPTPPNLNPAPVTTPTQQPNSSQGDVTNSTTTTTQSPKDGERKKTSSAESAATLKSSGALKAKRGSASFAIIPNVVFNFSLDTEEDGTSDRQTVEKGGEGTPADASTEEGSEAFSGKGDEEQEAGTDERTGHAATQTLTRSGTLLRCPACKQTRETFRLLSEHLADQHPSKAGLACHVCQVVCPTPGGLAIHLAQRHGPKPRQVQSGAVAGVMAGGAGALRCDTCSKECLSSASLRWHRTLVHQEGGSGGRGPQARLKCGLCNYTAVDSWDMRHHREQHRFQPVTCCVCSKTFSTEASLKIHMAAKHSGQSYTCHLCHKAFAHLRYLRCHLQRHRGEKRHVCPVCGWRFFQANTLRAHMDTHKPKVQRRYAFRCPHCPAAYTSQANYRDHLNKHTGERPHLCGQCGRGFAYRSMLTTHAAFVHSSLRPHSCNECDKKYKTKTQLRQHQMTHTMAKTGKSPFMCGKCSRPMASKARLRAHGKCCKGGNFVWPQHGGPGRQQAKVQAVSMVGQPVNLLDLLPGQQIKVVHHGVGKDATITLIPMQDEAATAQDASLAHTETTPPLRQVDSLLAEPWKPQELNKTEAVCDALNLNPSTQLVESSGRDEPELVSDMENCLGELKTPGSQTSVSVISDNGGSPAYFVQSGHTVNLLSGLELARLKDSRPGHTSELSAIITSQPRTVSDSAPSFILEESFQPEEEALQTGAPSHRLVFSDSFGQTQTVLLPPDLVKQEVVVIETEGGQQNILDLSNVQFIQTSSILPQASSILPGLGGREDGVQGDSGSQGMAVFQASLDPLQVEENLRVVENLQVEENHLPVPPADGGEEVGAPPGEASVYICSSCDQQFSSMELAQQHVIVSHALDPPGGLTHNPAVEEEEEAASEAMDTPHQQSFG
ncbi:hypothetical protein ACOMHN_056780 [Nucella lapillus]